MSVKATVVSLSTIYIDEGSSPTSDLFVVTSSPNALENRVWNLGVFSDIVQFNRVLKKRYAIFTPTGRHVRSVVEVTGRI